MGNAISRGLENKFTYAYDALHGGFKLNLSDFINTENKESQKIQISINEELENLRKNRFKNKLSQNKQAGARKKPERVEGTLSSELPEIFVKKSDK